MMHRPVGLGLTFHLHIKMHKAADIEINTPVMWYKNHLVPRYNPLYTPYVRERNPYSPPLVCKVQGNGDWGIHWECGLAHEQSDTFVDHVQTKTHNGIPAAHAFQGILMEWAVWKSAPQPVLLDASLEHPGKGGGGGRRQLKSILQVMQSITLKISNLTCNFCRNSSVHITWAISDKDQTTIFTRRDPCL